MQDLKAKFHPVSAMKTAFNFKIVVVYALCAVLLLGCQSSYEAQLSQYFQSQYSRDDLLSDPGNARWVAYGFLTGTVHHDHTDGYRYFSSVPKDEKKAAEIYQLLADQGDTTSQAQWFRSASSGNSWS